MAIIIIMTKLTFILMYINTIVCRRMVKEMDKNTEKDISLIPKIFEELALSMYLNRLLFLKALPKLMTCKTSDYYS